MDMIGKKREKKLKKEKENERTTRDRKENLMKLETTTCTNCTFFLILSSIHSLSLSEKSLIDFWIRGKWVWSSPDLVRREKKIRERNQVVWLPHRETLSMVAFKGMKEFFTSHSLFHPLTFCQTVGITVSLSFFLSLSLTLTFLTMRKKLTLELTERERERCCVSGTTLLPQSFSLKLSLSSSLFKFFFPH